MGQKWGDLPTDVEKPWWLPAISSRKSPREDTHREFDLCLRFGLETSIKSNHGIEELSNEQANPGDGFVRSSS
jgi:hypothetical protein